MILMAVYIFVHRIEIYTAKVKAQREKEQKWDDVHFTVVCSSISNHNLLDKINNLERKLQKAKLIE